MEIDEITYDVLDANEPLTLSEAVRRFENKYSEADLEEVLSEIEELISDNILYTKRYV